MTSSVDLVSDDLNNTFDVFQFAVNEAPTNIALTGTTIAENAAIGTVVGTFSGSDPDVGESFTYALVSGAGDDDNSQIIIDGDQLKAANRFDFEAQASYSIRVQVTDSEGGTFEKVFTITVTNVNEAPTDINFTARWVGENQPAGLPIGYFTAIDEDAGNTFTYTLVSGAGDTDNAQVEIVGNQLRSKVVFNYEVQSSYSVRVQAMDQNGLTYDKSSTFNVVDLNEAPTDITLSNNSVLEAQPAGTLVGILEAVDPDLGNSFTYSLVSGAGAEWNYAFEIVDDELRTKTPLNFEYRSSYTVRVRATDTGGLSKDKVFTINATDVNEAPLDLLLSKTTIPENQPVGTVVGTLRGLDPDAGSTLTYELVTGTGDTDNSHFEIVGNELRSKTVFHQATKNSYTLRIRTTDHEGLTFEKSFTLYIIKS